MIRTCASCGQKNRIAGAKLGLEARCGKCRTPFPPLAEPIDADAALFDEVIAHVSLPVLVDFWAEWCRPCRMAAGEVEGVAREMAGRALVLKVDTDKHPEVAQRYGVQGIPHFVVLRNGQPVFEHSGVVGRAEMRRWLEAG